MGSGADHEDLRQKFRLCGTNIRETRFLRRIGGENVRPASKSDGMTFSVESNIAGDSRRPEISAIRILVSGEIPMAETSDK